MATLWERWSGSNPTDFVPFSMERIFRVGALILCVVSWPLVSYAFSSRPLSLPTQAHLHSTLKAEPIRVSVAECCPPVAAGNCRGVNSAFRRHLVRSSAASLTSLVAMATYCPQPAHSIPFLGAGGADKRQIEIILIAVLRTRYWIESVVRRIELMLQYAPQEGPSDSQKEPYLEARLGAKALVTGRVGGGANARVYTLAQFELRACLKDGQYWASERGKEMGNKKALEREYDIASEGIVESLANVVEFDGLETTQDPSPRSSLMLSKYNQNKAIFVVRMLRERSIPSCDALVACFDGEARERSSKYIQEYYATELPSPPKVLEEDGSQSTDVER